MSGDGRILDCREGPVRASLERVPHLARSDYNPGTSPCFNPQTVAYLGRALFGLSAAEALMASRAPRHVCCAARPDVSRERYGDFVRCTSRRRDELGRQFGGSLAAAVVHQEC